MEQKLWALDLSLHYSDSLAMFQLMSYVSNGKLDPKTHVFDVPAPKQEKRQRRRRMVGQEEEVSLDQMIIIRCSVLLFLYLSDSMKMKEKIHCILKNLIEILP